MGVLGIVGVVGGIACLAACSDSSAAARGSDSKLVLELGGAHGSLRGALQAAGVEPAAPRRVTTLPPESPSTGTADPEVAGTGAERPPSSPDPVGEREPDRSADSPAPRVEAPNEPDYVVVTLGERQTLIHLARKHLGDANRFREILTLNGWSEADSRRLAAGQKVKIPRPSPRSSRR